MPWISERSFSGFGGRDGIALVWGGETAKNWNNKIRQGILNQRKHFDIISERFISFHLWGPIYLCISRIHEEESSITQQTLIFEIP